MKKENQPLAEVFGHVFFIDPPYTAGGKKAGNRLYTHFELGCVDISFGLLMASRSGCSDGVARRTCTLCVMA